MRCDGKIPTFKIMLTSSPTRQTEDCCSSQAAQILREFRPDSMVGEAGKGRGCSGLSVDGNFCRPSYTSQLPSRERERGEYFNSVLIINLDH